MKKLLTFLFLVLVTLTLSGCGNKSTSVTQNPPVGGEQSDQSTEVKVPGKKRDMMGQYSFGLAVCEEVKKDLVASVIGKPITETEDYSNNSETGCKYYTNKANFENIIINVSFTAAENQKKGQQALGRSITTNPKIPMDHFIAVQEDGTTINGIYLVMAPQKFVRVDRSSLKVADNDQMIDLASKVADIILYGEFVQN